MPLNLDGPETTRALAPRTEPAETAIEFEATEVAASVGVTVTGPSYAVGGFIQYAKAKGIGFVVKARKTFGR